jgi:glycosyltransferase involved in cell wall biosynthesis
LKIAVVTNQVPFMPGGAERLAEWLDERLRAAGHQSQVIRIPFSWRAPQRIIESMLAVRLIEMREVERVIALEFPAYYVRHDDKALWLLRQFRQAYELRGTEYDALGPTPEAEAVVRAVRVADTRLLSDAQRIFASSEIVKERLGRSTGLEAEVLYPPLGDASGYRCASVGDYVLCPGGLGRANRPVLLVESMALVRSDVRLVIAGAPGRPDDAGRIEQAIERCGVGERVRLLSGRISEDEKRDLLANTLACAYVPFDEDWYGYASLEAFESRKPVITCVDSGGTLELVEDGVTGLVVQPDPVSLAEAMDSLRADPARARRLGASGAERLDALRISWDHVVERLTA